MRQNLRVIMCMSPVGETLRVRARHFPSIVTQAAIDWFHAWPQEALLSVAARLSFSSIFNETYHITACLVLRKIPELCR